jgi:uncharacterized protein (TIGR00255 family)
VIRSMTAFASQQGSYDVSKGSVTYWTWDVRSINGRGLNLKLNLPEGEPELEVAVRSCVRNYIVRGNVTISLRFNCPQTESTLKIDSARVDIILEAFKIIQRNALNKGITLGQPTAADILVHCDMLVAAQVEKNTLLVDPLIVDLQAAFSSLVVMRENEGAVLKALLTSQTDQIEDLTSQALVAVKTRTLTVKSNMAVALKRVMDGAIGVDSDRVAQELALIAVKLDITEEIDRLGAHIKAVRDLLAYGGSIGRKLDFLTQEFNREANTLCAKAQDVPLLQIGLALKAVIDQMREQVQNVE